MKKEYRLYPLAAVFATIAAVLQLLDRDWFRAATGFALAATMGVAATGFPERSPANKRLYYVLLGIVSVLLIIQISQRWV